jgi:AcrR family transcriptional regulator
VRSPLPQAKRSGRRSTRANRSREERLKDILDAALDVFSERGFAQARLEDVAARAGIAKGTIYLYVSSKQELFETLVRSGIGGPIEAMAAPLVVLDAPVDAKLRTLFAFLRNEVLGTRRKDILLLLLAEAGRFPAIAELYHREVLTRGLGLLRALAEAAVRRGEFHSGELTRFPQLIVAPALVALLWAHLFERLEPLDSEAMLEAHVDLLMRAMRGEPR